MVELLQDTKFPQRAFELDCQRPPPMTPDVVDVIGLKYGRLFLRAKTIFHMEPVKVEITYLRMLITHNYRHINELELELKYLKRQEETRTKEASIFMAVRK